MTRFAAVGIGSFLLDCLVLWLVQSATASLLAAVVAARLISGTVNFIANRFLVFHAGDLPWQRSAMRYAALAGVVLVANYALLWSLTTLGLATMVAKLVTELTLVVASYLVQRLVVFARQAHLVHLPVALSVAVFDEEEHRVAA